MDLEPASFVRILKMYDKMFSYITTIYVHPSSLFCYDSYENLILRKAKSLLQYIMRDFTTSLTNFAILDVFYDSILFY